MHLFLPLCAAVFCAGVALGRHWQPQVALALVAACVACAVALAWARRWPFLTAGVLLLAASAGGAALSARAWSVETPACHVSRHTGR